MSAVTAISLNGDISRDTGEGKSTAIDVQLCIQDQGVRYDADLVNSVLHKALTQLFGLIGGAAHFTVVACDSQSGVATLLLHNRDLAKVQAAVTLIDHHGNHPASVKVLAVRRS
mmetsp:Transcript_8266/g.24674  ORF Transcript_8266/g.24674 Transcript_8266/m.24674 type:complete len:114 (+) Transcript_8266:278-619(+)